MEQDITFYDKLAISRDPNPKKSTFYDFISPKINLEFMKDQPDETPIKKI